jgi:hypothetical protein
MSSLRPSLSSSMTRRGGLPLTATSSTTVYTWDNSEKVGSKYSKVIRQNGNNVEVVEDQAKTMDEKQYFNEIKGQMQNIHQTMFGNLLENLGDADSIFSPSSSALGYQRPPRRTALLQDKRGPPQSSQPKKYGEQQ